MGSRVALRSPGARIVAAALGVLIAAELAVLLLAPAQPGPEALDVEAASYLEPGTLQAAKDYRAESRLIALVALALEFAALTAMALGHPRRLWAWVRDLQERRPLRAALAAGACISAVLAAVALPTGLLGLDLRIDFRLSTESVGGWLFDRARAALIALLIAAVAALLLVVAQRRLSRGWWVAGAGGVVAYAAVLSLLAPVALAPIFNDFEPLPAGQTRADVNQLAERAGVEIGEVYRIDASSRATTLSAYVDGIGVSRRVVLYDNLIEGADRDALRWVVAHELAHISQRDIPRGLLFVALVSLPGMLLVRELGGALANRTGAQLGSAAAVPAYALAITLTGFAIGPVSNQLSRAVEERADRFALDVAGEPAAMISLQTLVSERNLSDPDPPALWQALFGTHPSKSERLGLAEAYRRSDGR